VVHTCPRCELRFASDAELADHAHTDHGFDADAFERFHYRPIERRPMGRRYLVVANQTLLDDAVTARIEALAKDGGHFHIVVPATPHEGSTAGLDDKGLALATYRVRHIIDRLRAAGIVAEGEVGDRDPVVAVGRALAHEQADEILVSTLPHGVSDWLLRDLPSALRTRFRLPVAVVTREA
jgi:hypothetical protein